MGAFDGRDEAQGSALTRSEQLGRIVFNYCVAHRAEFAVFRRTTTSVNCGGQDSGDSERKLK
jgi:hypothetical protein